MGIKSSNVIFNDIRFRSVSGSTFGLWGDFYVNNPGDYTLNGDTSIDLLPDTDTTIPMTSGVYKNELVSGDFTATFNVLDWGGNNTGQLGITIIDSTTKTILDPIQYVEIASYSAFNGGQPFFRRRSPYAYETLPSIGSNAQVYFKATRSGSTLTLSAGNTSAASSYSQTITYSDDCYIGVSYYSGSAGITNVTKEVRDFIIV